MDKSEKVVGSHDVQDGQFMALEYLRCLEGAHIICAVIPNYCFSPRAHAQQLAHFLKLWVVRFVFVCKV